MGFYFFLEMEQRHSGAMSFGNFEALNYTSWKLPAKTRCLVIRKKVTSLSIAKFSSA